MGVGNVLIAPDGDHYVSRYYRQLSERFIVNLAGRQSAAFPIGVHP